MIGNCHQEKNLEVWHSLNYLYISFYLYQYLLSYYCFHKYKSFSNKHKIEEKIKLLFQNDLETVDSTTALAEGGDDVLDGDGLVLGVFGVGGGITNDTVDEAAEDITDFTVDGTSDALDTTTASEAADGALRDGGGVSLEDLLDALTSTSGLTLSHFVEDGDEVLKVFSVK